MATSTVSHEDLKDVFTTLSQKLITDINVKRAVSEAHKLKLIGNWQRSDCLKHGSNQFDMGNELVSILIRKINASSDNFYTLLQVLRNIEEFDLVREFEEELNVKKLNALQNPMDREAKDLFQLEEKHLRSVKTRQTELDSSPVESGRSTESIFKDEILPQIPELWLELAKEVGVPIEHVTAIQKKCFEEVLDYWKNHPQALNLPYNRDSMVKVLLSAPVNRPELAQRIRDMNVNEGGNDRPDYLS